MNILFMQSINTSYSYFPDSFKKTLKSQHNKSNILRAYLSPRSGIILGLYQNILQGYSIFRLDSEEPSTLLWLYVATGARGSGLGSRMVEATHNQVRDYGSSGIRLVTHDQADFFSNHGYVQLRRIPGLLAGVDMTSMELSW